MQAVVYNGAHTVYPILYPEIRNSITHMTLAYKVHRFQQTYSTELFVCFAVHKIECGILQKISSSFM